MNTLFRVLLLVLCTASFLPAQGIKWLSWEEAIARNQRSPRKIVVDVYTGWCGWCKKMDKAVFADPQVAAYVNANFYPVKFNAESRKEIRYGGHTLRYDANRGRRGAHELAVALLDGRMSYPSIVYLDGSEQRISISPGFKPADSFLRELEFIQGEHYRNQTFREYLAGKK